MEVRRVEENSGMDEKQMHKFWDCFYVLFIIVSSILCWQLGDGFGG